MRVILRDGVGVHHEMEIPDGHTFVTVKEMVPHDSLAQVVPTMDTRYVWSGRFDQRTGAAIFVPDFLLGR